MAIWFAIVPLRLRALAMLAIGGVAAGVVVAWTLAQPALADDDVSLAARSSAGHRLGLLLLVGAAARLRRGAGASLRRRSQPARAGARRRLGIAVLVALALVPVAAIGAAAHSSRGLFGTISHGWHELTTPNAQQPSNSASRLTSTGSMQALYWSYALHIFDANPLAGAGAGSYGVASQRFMTGPDKALQRSRLHLPDARRPRPDRAGAEPRRRRSAGAIAAVRAVGPFRARAPDAGAAERLGLLTMIVVVITFAVHSAIDWVYFVPGEALIALLCAGWVAGRGPVASSRSSPVSARSPGWRARRSPRRVRRRRSRWRSSSPGRSGSRCARSRPPPPAPTSWATPTRR